MQIDKVECFITQYLSQTYVELCNFMKYKAVYIITRRRWQLKCLRSKPWICLRENENKRKAEEHFLVMLHYSKSFRELRWAL